MPFVFYSWLCFNQPHWYGVSTTNINRSVHTHTKKERLNNMLSVLTFSFPFTATVKSTMISETVCFSVYLSAFHVNISFVDISVESESPLIIFLTSIIFSFQIASMTTIKKNILIWVQCFTLILFMLFIMCTDDIH